MIIVPGILCVMNLIVGRKQPQKETSEENNLGRKRPIERTTSEGNDQLKEQPRKETSFEETTTKAIYQ